MANEYSQTFKLLMKSTDEGLSQKRLVFLSSRLYTVIKVILCISGLLQAHVQINKSYLICQSFGL